MDEEEKKKEGDGSSVSLGVTEKMAVERRPRWRSHLLRTSCNSLAMLMLGLIMSMKGPSFLDLQMISGVDVEKGSFYFTIHAFGYMTGSLVVGALYSRFTVKTILVIISMIISSILQVLTPWCANFVLMLLVSGLPSVFWAITETIVNTEEVHAWEGNSDSAMQFLSFAYSLGGIIGPLIVEPFLSPKPNDTASEAGAQNFTDTVGTEHNITTVFNVTSGDILIPSYNLQIDQPQGSLSSNMTANISNSSTDLDLSYNNSIEENPAYSEDYQSNIHYAYLISGILILVSTIPFCVLYVKTWRTVRRKVTEDESSAEQVKKRLPLKMYIILMGTIGIFYFFYTTVDDSYPMYLSVFVVSHLNWSKEDGARVSSLYWGSSTATKLVMVILVHRVNTSVVLLLSTIGMVLSMTLFTICAHYKIHIMIWICTGILALSQSSVFGGGFAWADANLLKFDGRVTSCAMIFASLGAMVDPMLLGVSMKEISPMSFPVIMTLQALITSLLFLLMLVIAKPYVTKRYGPPRPSISHNISVDRERSSLNGDAKHRNLDNTTDRILEEEGDPML